MITVNMPGGGTQKLGSNEIMWLRHALSEEHEGAVMIKTGSSRLYAAEALTDLCRKIGSGGTRLCVFTAPDSPLELWVNVDAVRQVEPASAAAHHAQAKACLIFTPALKLAVRETPEQAENMIRTAHA